MDKLPDDACYIRLNKGKRRRPFYAIIDKEDYDRVMRHKWYAVASGKTFYAISTSSYGLAQHHRRLHAFIMRTQAWELVDHRNGNGLDCRKENLRPATPVQNNHNSYKSAGPGLTSKFKGVSLSSSGKWLAQITVDATPVALGLFESDEDAAKAYDAAAMKHFGEFARTNAMMGLFEGEKPVRPSFADAAPYRDDDKRIENRVADHRLRRKIAARQRRKAEAA